jgi:hypothetical protein
MIEQLLNQTATIQHRAVTGTDAHGNPTTGAASSDTVDCYLEQRRQATLNEVEGRQDTAEAFWNLFLPVGTTIDHTDRVVVGGVTFEVVDIPWAAVRATTGAAHHVEVTLRATEG